MTIKPLFTYDPHQKQYRLFRCLWQRGIVGDGQGFSAYVSLSLVPRFMHVQREWCSIIIVLLGCRFHYKRSYGGILV
jgi:hypothetical protein